MCRAVLLSNAQTCGTVLVSPAIPSEPPVVVNLSAQRRGSGRGRAVRARRSEPTIKMLRYQQHFTFFDQAKLDGPVRFINLSQFSLEKDLNYVLSEIVKQIEAYDDRSSWRTPFRTVVRRAQVTVT
jgi:hypothetical protein